MLDKVAEFDIKNIAEQAVNLARCAGFMLLSVSPQHQADRVVIYWRDGKAVDVFGFDFAIGEADVSGSAMHPVQTLVINGADLLVDCCGIARLLELEDGTAIGILIILAEQDSNADATAELALELACERLKLALERSHTNKCPVISTNTHLNQKLELLNEIGSISKTGGWQVDLSNGEITWTDEMYSLYGLPLGAPVTISSSMAYFPKDTKNAIMESFQRVIKDGKEYCHEGFLHRADGKILRIKATGKPRYTGKLVTHVYGALEDITEHYRLLETEYNYAAYLTAILDNLNDVVVTIDTNGTIITANKTMSTIFGYEPEDVMGQDVSILMPEPYAKYHSEFLKHYLDTGRAKIIGVGRELPGLHKSGRVFPIELSLSEVVQDGQRQFIGIVKDITERKRAMEEIYHTAYFDDLTKLPNMRSFEMDLARVLNQASSQYNALDIYCCLIDMDSFTQYNLSFGKHVGDKILATIGERIKQVLDGDLRVYRGIGDNFLILSIAPIDGENRESENPINTLEWEIHKAIVMPIQVDDLSHSVTAAISSCRLEASKASYEKVNGVLSFGKKRAKKTRPWQCINT